MDLQTQHVEMVHGVTCLTDVNKNENNGLSLQHIQIQCTLLHSSIYVLCQIFSDELIWVTLLVVVIE